MIRVDETDPVGEIEPSFPYKNVSLRRGVEFETCYDIDSEIGRGKFGIVYRCKDKTNHLQLAAKVVTITKKEDRRSVEREVEIMRRLQHPRLIQLYDAIDAGQTIYVILELIEGGELFERVIDDDFMLTERSCAVFMRQICEGIEFIHSQKILHLDLKPENILCLTKEGNRIKIIDFGLAREYDPKKKLQVLFGTPEFVAPEVVNFDQIGFGTDMWSIGVICYVLLSGLSPFMGDDDIETMANVTVAKYDFDHEAFTDISEDAKDFIKSLLIKDKEKRASAAQCREHYWLARKSEKTRPIIEIPSVTMTLEKTFKDIDYLNEELDVAKDNLRLFVERWREHPDSPYTILEIPKHTCSKHSRENDELSISLRGQSPSPCESICSTVSEQTDISPNDTPTYRLSVPTYSSARRASEGWNIERRDQASQIMLAEEIIKLSEHLRSIANGTSNESKGTTDKLKSKIESSKNVETNRQNISQYRGNTTKSILVEGKESNEITEKLSNLTRQRKLNGTTFHSSRSFETRTETSPGEVFASFRRMSKSGNLGGNMSIEEETETFTEKKGVRSSTREFSKDTLDDFNMNKSSLRQTVSKMPDLSPPWRRSRVKHSFGETSRDVPRIANLQNLHKNLNLNEPSSTKDLLLHLLEEWDETSCARISNVGRKSVSVDWERGESVARKTLNSLAEYFQSEQQKSTTPGPTPNIPSTIHR